MKGIIVSIIIALFVLDVSSVDPVERLGPNEAIIEFLEELRLRMCHPIDVLGLPALDPFQIKEKQYEMDNKYFIDFSASVNDFVLKGLSDFVINEIKISTIPFRESTINLSLPLTEFKTKYTAKGSLAYILNFNGHDDANAHVKEFNVIIKFKLKIGLKLSISDLKIMFKINEIFVNFENLIDEQRINDFFHNLINTIGIELLDDVWEAEHTYVEDIIQKKINVFLQPYSLSDLLNMIANGDDIFKDGPEPDCKTNDVLQSH